MAEMDDVLNSLLPHHANEGGWNLLDEQQGLKLLMIIENG